MPQRKAVAMLGVVVLSASFCFFLLQQQTLSSDIFPLQLEPPPPSFQCSLVWLRLPKTASTTTAYQFVAPLAKAAEMTNTEIGYNTCISNVGGCAQFWGDKSRPSLPNPPYVQLRAETNQRCFPTTTDNNRTKSGIRCYEFDAESSTMNFGPYRRSKNKNQDPLISVVPAIKQAQFNYSPIRAQHVGLDPSLFGWVLPQKPMVISTFRDPIDRLISSFHYGVNYGGGRPGEIKKTICSYQDLGVSNLKEWQERVVRAREILTLRNEPKYYMLALRTYLNKCRAAVDNVYVQFLDPVTKDVDVALHHLNTYVIVGLQTDMEETLQRWKKIAFNSCNDHPKFQAIKDTLEESAHSVMHRPSIVQVDSQHNGKVVDPLQPEDDSEIAADDTENEGETAAEEVVDLVKWRFRFFDDDVKRLMRQLTKHDEVIYKRVLEMYDEQRNWG
jgi:hypothetical protein